MDLINEDDLMGYATEYEEQESALSSLSRMYLETELDREAQRATRRTSLQRRKRDKVKPGGFALAN